MPLGVCRPPRAGRSLQMCWSCPPSTAVIAPFPHGTQDSKADGCSQGWLDQECAGGTLSKGCKV
eukprot:195383-Alexandrium_andersonii.AAC.1